MRKFNLGLVLFFAAAMFSLSLVSADIGVSAFGSGMMGGARGMMYGGYGYGMMFFGWLTYLLVIALIIAAIYWLIKSANRKK